MWHSAKENVPRRVSMRRRTFASVHKVKTSQTETANMYDMTGQLNFLFASSIEKV